MSNAERAVMAKWDAMSPLARADWLTNHNNPVSIAKPQILVFRSWMALNGGERALVFTHYAEEALSDYQRSLL